MDAFSYLSVLLSIILGLAITQVLQGIRSLLLARTRIRFYLPTLLWAGLILVIATQMWWSSFGLATHASWTFAAFGMVLLQTIVLYMLAALVLPDVQAGESLDLEAHYYREARPFYLLFVAAIATSFLKDLVLDGHVTTPVNMAFHIAFAALGLVAAFSHDRRLHLALTMFLALLMGTYIVLLFSVLG